MIRTINDKNLMVFEGNNVEILVGKNGEPLFELYSVGMALGYINKRKNSTGKEYISPYKSRIDKVVESAEITCVCQGVTQYLTEEMLYDFMFEAKTEKCRAFKKWLSKEVLPCLRRDGGYMITKEEESEEDFLARALIVAQKTIERKNQRLKEAQAEILVLEDENKNLKAFLGNDEIFSKATLANKLDTHPTVMAKILKECGVYTKTCQVSESFKEKYPDIKITKDVDVPYFHPTIGRTFKTDWQWTKEGAFEVIKYLKEIGLVIETQNGEFKIVKL